MYPFSSGFFSPLWKHSHSHSSCGLANLDAPVLAAAELAVNTRLAASHSGEPSCTSRKMGLNNSLCSIDRERVSAKKRFVYVAAH